MEIGGMRRDLIIVIISHILVRLFICYVIRLFVYSFIAFIAISMVFMV